MALPWALFGALPTPSSCLQNLLIISTPPDWLSPTLKSKTVKGRMVTFSQHAFWTMMGISGLTFLVLNDGFSWSSYVSDHLSKPFTNLSLGPFPGLKLPALCEPLRQQKTPWPTCYHAWAHARPFPSSHQSKRSSMFSVSQLYESRRSLTHSEN